MYQHLVRILSALTILCAATANAASIGFQFITDVNPLGFEAALNTSSTAGAPGYQQANWNVASPGVAVGNNGDHALIDSMGEATEVAIEWAANETWGNVNNGTSNPDAELMTNYIDNVVDSENPVGMATVTFSNIPFERYEVVTYFGSDVNGRTGHVTDGASSYSFSTSSHAPRGVPFDATDYALTSDQDDGFPAANYAVFSGLSGDSVTIDLLRGSGNAGFHAMQLVEIPEPTTGLLLIIGLVVGVVRLLGLRRHRSEGA